MSALFAYLDRRVERFFALMSTCTLERRQKPDATDRT